MKREFIASLKRLITFFNNIPQYNPPKEILEKTANFQDQNFEQQYRIFEYKPENDILK